MSPPAPPTPAPSRLRSALRAAPAVALVAFVLLAPLPESWHARWVGKLLDFGHVPLFAVLTVWLWLALGRSWVWSAGIALAVAGAAEVVQDWVGRTGDLLDFVRGALGVGAALVALHGLQNPRSPLRLAAHALAALALVAWPVADTLPWVLDAYEGARDFPSLADFATDRQLGRWQCRQAELRREPDPGQPSGASGRLELRPGNERYPSALLEPILRDWSGWRRVCCSFTVEGEPLIVVVSIRGRDAAARSTHYQFEKVYAPGAHVAQADLAAVAEKARPGRLDLTDVRTFQVFIYRPERKRVIHLHRVWLE